MNTVSVCVSKYAERGLGRLRETAYGRSMWSIDVGGYIYIFYLWKGSFYIGYIFIALGKERFF